MSTTTTITKPAPILEGSLTAFLKSIDKLGAGAVPSTFTGIDTSKFAPQVADQVKLQTDAAKAAADLGTLVGPDAYKQFMSPYQQDVIDTTLAEFDRQQAIADTALRDQAIEQELLVVDEKVLWQQRLQEELQQIEQTYKHNY